MSEDAKTGQGYALRSVSEFLGDIAPRGPTMRDYERNAVEAVKRALQTMNDHPEWSEVIMSAWGSASALPGNGLQDIADAINATIDELRATRYTTEQLAAMSRDAELRGPTFLDPSPNEPDHG